MSDPTALSLARAGDAIRTRRLSPLELADAYLARIARVNPALNAFVTVTAERARTDARRAADEIARGQCRGPLHGIPLGLKDLYDTAGIRTTYGSKVHAAHVPEVDSTIARRLGEAGVVLLGKENTHEYAWGVTTNNPHWGPTRNPWDQSRVPGGSSGGSAAAVAARLSAASMGSDTGGSIRVPAALCGVVGLKPTYGRVSKAGVFPMSYLFDHTGPIARTVEDAAVVLGVVAGYDPADASTVRTPVDDYRAALTGDVRGLRVGVPRRPFFQFATDEVRAAVDAAIDVLARLGAIVHEVALPLMGPGLLGVFVAEGRDIHAATLATRAQDLGRDVREILATPPPDGPGFSAALREISTLAEGVRAVLETVDVLVAPTTPMAAPPIGAEVVSVGGVEVSVLFALGQNTAPFNAARTPALSVPCGFTPAGLPIGLQIVGRPFDEATVLRAGDAYERATEWHTRAPTL